MSTSTDDENQVFDTKDKRKLVIKKAKIDSDEDDSSSISSHSLSGKTSNSSSSLSRGDKKQARLLEFPKIREQTDNQSSSGFYSSKQSDKDNNSKLKKDSLNSKFRPLSPVIRKQEDDEGVIDISCSDNSYPIAKKTTIKSKSDFEEDKFLNKYKI